MSFRVKGEDRDPLHYPMALPVFSVDSVQDARDFIMMIGARGVGNDEYYLSPGLMDYRKVIEVEELKEVTRHMETAYRHFKGGGDGAEPETDS